MKSKEIIPKKEIVRTLLSNYYFRVPLFQRSYSWSTIELSEFWEDLNNNSSNKYDFFFGSMVIKINKEEDYCEIIDGQQRVTSIILFLSVARDLLNQKNPEDGADIQNTYILSRRPFNEMKSKLLLNKEDDAFFQKYIVNKEEDILNVKLKGLPESHKNIVRAYRFFNKHIKDINLEGLINITSNLLENTYFILIEVDDDMQAYTVFETLNARGIDLSAADLIKNAVLARAQSKNILDEVYDSWILMTRNLDDIKLTNFFRNYATSKNKKGIVREKKLFKHLRETGSIKTNVHKFVSDLEKESKMYSQLIKPNLIFWESKEICEVLKNIKLLDLKSCYPCLLSIGMSDFSYSNKLKLFSLIEKLGFRHSIVLKLNPNNLEKKYAEWAYKIRNEDNFNKIVKEIQEEFPDDDDFYNEFKVMEVPENKIALYILKKISQNYIDSTFSINDNASLEHIVPEKYNKWEEYIRGNNELKIDDEDVSLKKFLESLIYRLGNMTILSEKDNSKLGNELFDVKKEQIFSKSKFKMNKDLSEVGLWNKEQIDARQENFAKQALKIW